jgi:hypothetical protein
MLIPRPDLGPHCRTHVLEGQIIPPEAVPFL